MSRYIGKVVVYDIVCDAPHVGVRTNKIKKRTEDFIDGFTRRERPVYGVVAEIKTYKGAEHAKQ